MLSERLLQNIPCTISPGAAGSHFLFLPAPRVGAFVQEKHVGNMRNNESCIGRRSSAYSSFMSLNSEIFLSTITAADLCTGTLMCSFSFVILMYYQFVH